MNYRRTHPIGLTFFASAALITALTGCDGVENPSDLFPSRNYYVPATAMLPTLALNATLVADWVDPSEVKRGDILIVRTENGEDYVKRLIALPSESFEMRAGTVILNGEPIEQRLVGPYEYTETGFDGLPDRTIYAKRYREYLPDTGATYFVIDEGDAPYDDFGPMTLGPDQYFFLGDNRDNSADSRAAPEMRGLGIVSGDQIKRRVDPASIAKAGQ